MAVSNNVLFDAAAALFANDVIDEEDLLAIYENTRIKSPEFQYWRYENVENQLQPMTNDETRSEFQVHLADIAVLVAAFPIPD